MKNHLIINILILFIFFSCSNVGLNTNKITMINKDINMALENFNNVKENLKTLEIELNDISSQGGNLIAKYDNKNHIKYIESNIYGELGKIFYEYYIINKNVVYIIEDKIQYNKSIYEKDFQTESEQINKYIIYQNNIYKYVSEGKMEEKKGQELIKDFKSFISLIKRENDKIKLLYNFKK